MKPTKTTNRIHFSDLDPQRFEDLCVNLVYRLTKWKKINHFGRTGNDEGIDILTVENDDKVWYIQCKRYAKINQSELKKIVDKVLINNPIPYKLLIMVSCDISKDNIKYIQEYSTIKNIKEVEIWTSSILEAKLYGEFPDLLFTFFGLGTRERAKSDEVKIRYSLRMEKKVLKGLIDERKITNTKSPILYMYEPFWKFVNEKALIRSISDKTYPEYISLANGVQPWFQAFFYDMYHDGIEFWLSVGVGADVIMDKDGFWEPVSHRDEKVKNPAYKLLRAEQIGRIPFSSIIDISTDGDNYNPIPHIYCKFEHNGMPFNEIYYRTTGSYDQRKMSEVLNKEKQIVLP